jgi:NAD(P)-dependent dehydrogenase (short-subunit alcohol dehydrogenase family)
VIGLTKNTAVNYGKKGIRCNVIMPGAMETNIAEGLLENGKPVMNQEGYQNMMLASAMDVGVSQLSDMADLATFLCSDQAIVLNGACISADKGWAAY